jgi:hypothetical protein
VIDDSEEPSRAGTPKPVPPEKDAPAGEPVGNAEAGGDSGPSNPNVDGKDASSHDGAANAPKPALTPELRQKLRKLEKLEATYPGMSDPREVSCILGGGKWKRQGGQRTDHGT